MKQQEYITIYPFNGYSGYDLIEYGKLIEYTDNKILVNKRNVDESLTGVLSYILFLSTRYQERKEKYNCNAFVDAIMYAFDYATINFIKKQINPEPKDYVKLIGIYRRHADNYPYLNKVIEFILYSKGYTFDKDDQERIVCYNGNGENVIDLINNSIKLLQEEMKKEKVKKLTFY